MGTASTAIPAAIGMAIVASRAKAFEDAFLERGMVGLDQRERGKQHALHRHRKAAAHFLGQGECGLVEAEL